MEFKTFKLKDLTIDGKGKYGIAASAVPYSKDLYTYLRITDINDNGTLNFEDLKSVDDDNVEKYILKPNDIVFARTGASTGRNYFYDIKDGVFVYAGFLIKFSLDSNKVNPRYIKYYCLSEKYKNWIKSFMTGSTRGNINAKTLGDMPIILPPRIQQDNMAKILSVIDDKIELNNRINDNLEQQAQAIFKNMFPSINSGNTEVGTYIVPKRGKNLTEKNAIFGDVPVVAGGLEPSIYHNKSNTTAPLITISASGANAGYIKLWHIPVWSSDSSFIDSNMTENVYFWYIVLKLRQKEIFDSQTGSVQPHIYPKHIAQLKIETISKEQITIFTQKVTPLFLMMGTKILENEKLIKIRDALLPKLISGKIDVSEIEI